MWFCLVRDKARWAGLLAICAILWWPRVTPPDIWIDPEGGNAAIRASAGAHVMRERVRQYGLEQWREHYGLRSQAISARDADYICKGYGCTPKSEAAMKVGFWFRNKPPKPERLTELCQISDLVILRSPVGDWLDECAGVNRISAVDFRTLGAIELTRQTDTQKGWEIKAAQPLRGHRYWSSPSQAEGDAAY
ncbi:hypothetical protein ABENE_01425 [Asticcacaulis benevestitus DSM 16100 = ATCC BAA-896]|uniref:Uncharacterized protein n=1 Tax=Asticcacaulis benevestitus DSM 16100 = ATCC BAA-896 TaxID=1121022 RepID=V4Q0Q5_9CAUL|nr:hypothetical protein ABENE_01425 [Asticcacaulis benevestitus DSM 16100 = ATCC BAA-896]